MKTLKELIDKKIICAIDLEGETVLGVFVHEPYGIYTGYAFRSLTCPRFIHEENEMAKLHGSEFIMKGFYAEVVSVINCEGDTFVCFDEETATDLEGYNFKRVAPIHAFGRFATFA